MESRSPAIKDSRASPVVDEMAQNQSKNSKEDAALRKSMCRYGPGCTHLMDPSHRDKFWHPRVQKLNDEQIKSHFICNECGYATNSLPDLQLHLQRKTAWSNQSLVGCRINCLVDLKEWHEGYVTQFHKSGKHFVEFRMLQERRWLVMKKVTFYIVERPVANIDGSEFKDSSDGESILAPVEDSWVFCEDISVDYAFAQSVLFKIYGNNLQETGHLTRGHVCITDSDRLQAQQSKSSLLYGELLPRGANKALGTNRLDAENAETLFDLGMGTGKILLQAFLQFRNLRYIYGVELSAGRYQLAEAAVLRMVELLGNENYHVHMSAGKFIMVTEAVKVASSRDENVLSGQEEEEYIERVLHFQCGNMFDLKEIDLADIVMMETDIPADLYTKLQRMLAQMKNNARILTYFDMRRVFEAGAAPFRQMDVNKHLSDRYPTSWSVQRGHHFYLWNKTSLPEPIAAAPSSWPFSSIVSTEPAEFSVYTHQKPSATPVLHENESPSNKDESRLQKSTAVSNSSKSSRQANTANINFNAPSPTITNDGRCLPFRPLLFFFSGSGTSYNTNVSGNTSSSKLSVASSSGVLANGTASGGYMNSSEPPHNQSYQTPKRNSGQRGSSDSRIQDNSQIHEYQSTVSIGSISPNRKKIMRYVGEDAHSRDGNVVSSPDASENVNDGTVSLTATTPIPNEQQADNAQREGDDVSKQIQSGISKDRISSVPSSTTSSPSKSAKRQSSNSGFSSRTKRSESPRVKRPPGSLSTSKKHQSFSGTSSGTFDFNSHGNDNPSNIEENWDFNRNSSPMKVAHENVSGYDDHHQSYDDAAIGLHQVQRGTDDDHLRSHFFIGEERNGCSNLGFQDVGAAPPAHSPGVFIGQDSFFHNSYGNNSISHDDSARRADNADPHHSPEQFSYLDHEGATDRNHPNCTVSAAVASTAEFSPDIRACIRASPLLADRELHQPAVALSPSMANSVCIGASATPTHKSPHSLNGYHSRHLAFGEENASFNLNYDQEITNLSNSNFNHPNTSFDVDSDITSSNSNNQTPAGSKRGLTIKKSRSRSKSPRSTTSPAIAEHSQDICIGDNEVEGNQSGAMQLFLPGEEESQFLGAVLPIKETCIPNSSEVTRTSPRREKSKKDSKKNGSSTSVSPSTALPTGAAASPAAASPTAASFTAVHQDLVTPYRDVTIASSRESFVTNLTTSLPLSQSVTPAERSTNDRQMNRDGGMSTTLSTRRNPSTHSNANGEGNRTNCVIS